MNDPPTATIDKTESRVRRMFGAISGRYDLMNHLLSGGVDYYWRFRTVRAGKVNGDAPILDVCTGTGDLALAWWKRHRQCVPVVGSDFTHEMLAIARRKSARKKRGDDSAPLEWIEADTQHLPFDDDQFQIVSVAFGLRNVTETRRGLSEMVRVCRPGGQVLILEFSQPTNRFFRTIYGWYFHRVLPRVGQWLARNDQSAYNYLPASVAEFPQGAALAELMQSCGLIETTFKPLTFGIATLYVGRKPELVNRRSFLHSAE